MITPQTKKIEKTLEIHNDLRIDNYYWLNERENPEVTEYLESENSFTENYFKPLKSFKKKLFKEIKNRIPERDESVPYLFNNYWYQSKYKKGKEYPVLYRWKNTNKKIKKELLLDENKLAKNSEYFELSGLMVSIDNKIVAYGIDAIGRRIYTIYFKNLKTGKTLKDKIKNTTGEGVWSNDNQTFYYVRQDQQTLRSFQVYKHVLGTSSKSDELVYEEKDETFHVGISKSKSRDFIFIESSNTISSEVHFLNANNQNDELKLIQKRIKNLEYSVEHHQEDFYIITNDKKSTNFKLVKTPIHQTDKKNWIDVITHRENVLLEGIELFNDYLVCEERENGLIYFNIIPYNEENSYRMELKEEVYSAYLTGNFELNSTKLRYSYSSLTTPWSTIEYDFTTKKEEILKQQKVLDKNFSTENYLTQRIFATVRDGVQVPISLVYHKNTSLGNETPLLLYGYGAYGISTDANFSSARLSLLDRGFIFAIAHIRGGEDLGRKWYEDGKMLKKKNTFFDFIDCAKHLLAEHYTSSQHIYAEGGSAGGLLMGAVINYEPNLFNGVISSVPFVDVVTTMLDDTIPLTTSEYDEWGNPKVKKYYDYIKSYSPYDNIHATEYPNLLVLTGLHDSQVQYWEPAKWVAKLREHHKGSQIILFKTNLSAGHSGASGRFEHLKEVALEFTFLLHLENKI